MKRVGKRLGSFVGLLAMVLSAHAAYDAAASGAGMRSLRRVSGTPTTKAAVTTPPLRTAVLDAADLDGVLIEGLLAGTKYVVTATGTYTIDAAGSIADAECSSMGADRSMQRNRYALLGQGDIGDLLLGGSPVEWQAAEPDRLGCDPTHTYRASFIAPSSSVRMALLEPTKPGVADNVGRLNVNFAAPAPLTSSSTSSSAEPPLATTQSSHEVTPMHVLGETLTISARNDTLAISAPLLAGQPYLIEVEGTYNWGASSLADAECSNSFFDANWLRNRFGAAYPGTDFLDVDIRPVNSKTDVNIEWAGMNGNGDGCDLSDPHVYRVVFVPAETTSYTFSVDDPNAGDNSGSLTARIYRIQEIPTGVVFVDSSKQAGVASDALTAGQRYRFEAQGVYVWYAPGGPGYNADAECTAAPLDTYRANRFPGHPTGDFGDIAVAGNQVTWQPRTGAGPCDDAHIYSTFLTPSADGAVNLRVVDDVHADNVGVVPVVVYASFV